MLSGSRLRIAVARWISEVMIRGVSAAFPRAARAVSSRLPMVALIAHVRSWGCSRLSQLRHSSAWVPDRKSVV